MKVSLYSMREAPSLRINIPTHFSMLKLKSHIVKTSVKQSTKFIHIHWFKGTKNAVKC